MTAIDPITFDQLRELITLAIIIIAFIAVYKSVPADKVATLRTLAGEAADKTETQADDILLQVYDYLALRFGGRRASEPVPTVEAPQEDKPRD